MSTIPMELLVILLSRSVRPSRYTVMEYNVSIKCLGTNAQCLPSNVRANPPAHSYLTYTCTTLSVLVRSLVD